MLINVECWLITQWRVKNYINYKLNHLIDINIKSCTCLLLSKCNSLLTASAKTCSDKRQVDKLILVFFVWGRFITSNTQYSTYLLIYVTCYYPPVIMHFNIEPSQAAMTDYVIMAHPERCCSLIYHAAADCTLVFWSMVKQCCKE